jgi:hypothetical protein
MDENSQFPTFDQIHLQIARDCFPNGIEPEDAFIVFGIFYNYRIVLLGAVIKDMPDMRIVHAVTQRYAGEILATIQSPGQNKNHDFLYWYYKWNTEWKGDYHFSHLSDVEHARLQEVISIIEHHPFVDHMELDDE